MLSYSGEKNSFSSSISTSQERRTIGQLYCWTKTNFNTFIQVGKNTGKKLWVLEINRTLLYLVEKSFMENMANCQQKHKYNIG